MSIGALNGLLQLSRNDPRAFNHKDILRIYKRMFLKLITSKLQSFERKLGGSSIIPVLKDIDAELVKDG
jgi:hypothetical protein